MTMERPYRSHLQPACHACRRRKSRCKREGASAGCLMCQVHGTPCEFPAQERTTRDAVAASPSGRRRSGRADARQAPRPRYYAQRCNSARTPGPSSHHQEDSSRGTAQNGPSLPRSQQIDPVIEPSSSLNSQPRTADMFGRLSDITVDEHDTEKAGPHIIGPMATNDANALQQYLGNNRKIHGARVVRPASRPGQAESRMHDPVLFKTISRHPIGVNSSQSPGRSQLHIIEKLIEPHANRLVDAYLEHLNDCFPVLDATSFRQHYTAGKGNLSPALLACLYANSMILWSQTISSEEQRCPDTRFIWVQAEDAIRAELLLSPGMSTIVGILLDIGGRPTTSMLGNAISMGAVVSLSHALGLNRDPSEWSIPAEEKILRIRLWWAVVIHDRWCSLAYGTPPHIHKGQYDVPMPVLIQVNAPPGSTDVSINMFIYLCSLSEVLGDCLAHVYYLDTRTLLQHHGNNKIEQLIQDLENWESSLDALANAVVIQGEMHDIPGGANLRLAYLSLSMHIRRIRLDEWKPSVDLDSPSELRASAEEAADHIVTFIVQLRLGQIQGFWHPVSAFSIASACTLLIRCAIEGHVNDPPGLRQSKGVRRADDLLAALKTYKIRHAWDIGDICISQCDRVVQEIIEADAFTRTDRSEQEPTEDLDNEAFAIGELFPSVWDLIEADYANELFAD